MDGLDETFDEDLLSMSSENYKEVEFEIDERSTRMQQGSEEDPSEVSDENPEEQQGDELSTEPEEDPEEEPIEESRENLEEEQGGEMGNEPEEDPEEEPIEESKENLEEEQGGEMSNEPEEDPEEEVIEESKENPEEGRGYEMNNEPEEDAEEELIEESKENPEEQSEEEDAAKLTQNSLEASLLKLYSDNEACKYEDQSVPICWGEKKSLPRARFSDLDSEQVYQRQKKPRQNESLISELGGPTVWELSNRAELRNQLNDQYVFEQTRYARTSKKKQHGRWDAQPNAGGEVKNDGMDWINMNSALAGLNPETLRLKADLLEIIDKLMKPELHDDRTEDERSPSPEPVYNNLGIRINTREVRLRERLFEERHYIISKLVEKDPSFIPPHDYKSPKFFQKLYLPTKKYPGFNFIGLLLGPRGSTHKRMELETGAKIKIRGKGSSKTSQNFPSDKEELHVYVEADNKSSLESAVSMVRKLLNLSDETFELKRVQLQELSKLYGTSKDANVNNDCGEQVNQFQHYPLPYLLSTLELAFSSDASDCNSNPTCLLASSSPISNSCQGTVRAGPSSSQTVPGKPNKEIDDKNLYVCHLPISLNENNLECLFSAFGSVSSVKVARDPVTGISKGYGFVRYENPNDAAAAVTRMNGYELNGHILSVRIARHPPVAVPSASSSHGNFMEGSTLLALGKTPVTSSKPDKEIDLANLYVGYLPRKVDENRLIELFSPFGEITGARVMKDRFTGTSKGYGFVHYKNASDAVLAISQMNGREVDEHMLAVRLAGPFKRSSGSLLVGGSNRETNDSKLIIFYLPLAVDENCLMQLFSQFGKIILAKVARDHRGISKGTGFIHFENAHAAEMAVAQMNGFVIEGHMLKVEVARPRPIIGLPTLSSHRNPLQDSFRHGHFPPRYNANLSVRHIPAYVDENYLKLLFSPFGEIIEIKLIRDQTIGIKNGCGLICFKDASDAAMAALQMNGFKIKGQFLEVKAGECSPVTASPSASPSSNSLGSIGLHSYPRKEINPANLFVGYLPVAADENCLMQLFSQFGKITGVKLLRDHITGVSKGCGFVNFENARDAAMAVKSVNGYIFGGHQLAVRVAGCYPCATSVSSVFPQYCGPTTSSESVKSRPMPGISGPLSSETQASIISATDMKMFPSSVYQGTGNVSSAIEAFDYTPQINLSHSDSNNESNRQTADKD